MMMIIMMIMMMIITGTFLCDHLALPRVSRSEVTRSCQKFQGHAKRVAAYDFRNWVDRSELRGQARQKATQRLSSSNVSLHRSSNRRRRRCGRRPRRRRSTSSSPSSS